MGSFVHDWIHDELFSGLFVKKKGSYLDDPNLNKSVIFKRMPASPASNKLH